MAVVPFQTSQTVAPPAPQFTPLRQPEQQGPGLGEAMQKLGGSVNEFAHDQLALDMQVGEANARDAANAYIEQSEEIKQPYLTLENKAAVDASADTQAQIKALHDRIVAQAKDPYTRKAVEDALAPRLTNDLAQVNGHSLGQLKSWQISGAVATRDLAIKDAGNNWSDPKAGDLAVDTIRSSSRRIAELRGIPPDDPIAKDLESKGVSAGRSDINLRILYSGSPESIAVARAYREKYGNDYVSDDAQKVDLHIDTVERSAAQPAKRGCKIAAPRP
jgi:hypothetical protein